MRQYRGLTKDSNWVYGNLVVNNARKSDGIHKAEPLKTYIRERNQTWISKTDDKCWRYLTFEVVPETVGQYTGIKDKNGKEAYQHDNIRGLIDGELHEWIIEWEETDDYCGWNIGLDNMPFEIIGNKWEKQ